jgi:hypothetical protein
VELPGRSPVRPARLHADRHHRRRDADPDRRDFIAFASSGVAFIKLFGIGLTLAVLVDAFVIRATLVPAFMTLAGDANWWAPRWLRRVHARMGISEHVELDEQIAPR